MRDITCLVQQATSTQGLLTVSRAAELGVDRRVLARLCEAGVFERAARGVYRLPGSARTWMQALGIVCLSGAPPAAGSHRSALRVWEMRTSEELEATVRYPRSRRVEGAIIHRSADLETGDVTWFDGIPVTTPVRTICDAGLIFPPSEVGRLLDHAIATGVVERQDLWRFRRRVGKQGRNGVGVLHALLERLPAGAEQTESGPEVDLLRLCLEFGLAAPAVQVPIVVGGEHFRADLAYPERRVLLEYDGFDVHTTPERFAADRRRQNLLVLAGWTVLRFTKADLRQRRSAAAAEIRRTLIGFSAR